MMLPQLIDGAGTECGVPISGQHLRNDGYTTFYSYLLMQPLLVLECVCPVDDTDVESLGRVDSFREDPRIPQVFRATLQHFQGTPFDRGHLAPFADMRSSREGVASFLLSNMSPQLPGFNRGAWKQLEAEVRHGLTSGERRWVASGPVFLGAQIHKPLTCNTARSIPVPDMYFKSTITESARGAMKGKHWLIRHDETSGPEDVKLSKLEDTIGQILWTRIADRRRIE